MTSVFALVRRNLRVYIRQPSGILFSFISALVVLLLYLLFLGQLQIDNITERLPSADDHLVGSFVDVWVMSGIVMISAFTTGLGAASVLVDDRASGRFKVFALLPLPRWKLATSYAVAVWVVAIAFTLAILAIGTAYLSFTGGLDLSFGWVLGAVGCSLLMCSVFSFLSIVLVSFTNNTGAFAAVSTIVGTAIGFMGLTYLPPGLLTQTVIDWLVRMPFAQASILARRTLGGQSLEALTNSEPNAMREVGEYYGYSLDPFVDQTSSTGLILALVAFGALFAVAAVWRLSKVLAYVSD